MSLQKIMSRKVGFLWVVVAIFFGILNIILLLMFLIAGVAFHNLTNYIVDGHMSCADYCEARGQPLFLHDVVTEACQCYNEQEDPRDYKNLQTGVEFVHEEG